MKSLMNGQKGFSHIIVIFGIVFLAVVGLAGYKVMDMNKNADSAAINTAQVAVPEKINSKADLDATSKSLDNSASELDAGLADESLDADLNDML